MADTLVVKQNDTRPPLVVELTDFDGTVANLSGATVKVIGVRRATGEAVFSRAPASATSTGIVTMPLEATDTAVVGKINVEIEVTWNGGGVQTFPPDGYLLIDVVDDLG